MWWVVGILGYCILALGGLIWMCSEAEEMAAEYDYEK